MRMLLDKFQLIANCYGGSNVLHMLILHSKCSINVPTSCVRPGTCRNIWNVPNLLLVGKWQVLSTRACNVLKMFSSVSRPPHPQWLIKSIACLLVVRYPTRGTSTPYISRRLVFSHGQILGPGRKCSGSRRSEYQVDVCDTVVHRSPVV